MNWDEVICGGCGLINDYTITVKVGQNICRCNGCDKFLGCKPKQPGDPQVMRFGKYKGMLVSEIDSSSYLEWIVENVKPKGTLLVAIENQLAELIINGK